MSRRAQENIVAGVLLCVFVGYLLITLGFGPNARLVPLPIAILGLFLLVIQLVRQNLRDAKELHVDLFASLTGQVTPEIASAAEQTPVIGPAAHFRRELQAGLFIATFVGLIALLGPVTAVFLFSTGFLALTRHYAPARALVVGTAFTVALYVLFVFGLQLQLYHGILEPFFAP